MPRCPLKTLQDRFLSSETTAERNVLDYVSQFRERLHRANALAKQSLSASQAVMKRRYDRSAVSRRFQVGDKVLALLPIPGSDLSAKFSGPYDVQKCLSAIDYVISTPERKRKTCLCHENMFKLYYAKVSESPEKLSSVQAPVISGNCALIVTGAPSMCDDEDVMTCHSSHQSARLPNSEMFKVLPIWLSHLSSEQQRDVTELMDRFPCLFGDVLTRTTVLQHDIDVKDELMKKEVDYLAQHGLATPSSSSWSSLCLLEAKSDGSPRFITDF